MSDEMAFILFRQLPEPDPFYEDELVEKLADNLAAFEIRRKGF